MTATTATINLEGGEMDKYDLLKGGKVVQSGVADPVKISGLTPDTDYKDYSVAFAGEEEATTATFKTSKQAVTGVTLDKTTLALDTGATATVKATVAPSNASDQSISFASSDEAVAKVDAKSGKITAVKAGTADVTVTTHDGAKKATVKVTVKDPVVNVTGVSVDKTEVSVEEGATANVKATVAPANATDKTVTWKSGNAETATVDSNGQITGVKDGTVNVVATTKDGGKTATVAVTVTAKPTE